MTRGELEHIIRAAGTLANVEDLIVIGSQAVLGEFPGAPAELLASNEADIYPLHSPERSDLIDSTIGEGSPVQSAFGYCARGVSEESAILPDGWRDRLILVDGENTRFVRGWRLEVHDLAIAKYAAGREKDRDFTRALARHAMVQRGVLVERLAATDVMPQIRSLAMDRIQSDFAKSDFRTPESAFGCSICHTAARYKVEVFHKYNRIVFNHLQGFLLLSCLKSGIPKQT